MKRNDLIIFEFANPISGDEVLLDPKIVVELSSFLTTTTTLWANGHGKERFSVLLAGVERGSVKIGFLIRFMEQMNTTFDFAANAREAIIGAGVAAGVFVLTGSAAPAPAVTEAFVQACGGELTRLVRVAASTRAEEVSVSIAGCGTAVITNSASKDIQLVGSSAPVATKIYDGTYDGPLRNIEGPFELTGIDEGGLVSVYSGEVKLPEDGWIPVIIRWGSKRPVEIAMEQQEVSVRGSLGHVESLTMRLKSNHPIDPALRKVMAALHVSGQNVSE